MFGSPGKDNISSILNYCILYTKYYIYTRQANSNKFDLLSFPSYSKNKLEIENIYVYYRTNNLSHLPVLA